MAIIFFRTILPPDALEGDPQAAPEPPWFLPELQVPASRHGGRGALPSASIRPSPASRDALPLRQPATPVRCLEEQQHTMGVLFFRSRRPCFLLAPRSVAVRCSPSPPATAAPRHRLPPDPVGASPASSVSISSARRCRALRVLTAASLGQRNWPAWWASSQTASRWPVSAQRVPVSLRS